MNEAFMCGVSWASKILVEIGDNHSSNLSADEVRYLKIAISSLLDLQMIMRRRQRPEPMKAGEYTPIKE